MDLFQEDVGVSLMLSITSY